MTVKANNVVKMARMSTCLDATLLHSRRRRVHIEWSQQPDL